MAVARSTLASVIAPSLKRERAGARRAGDYRPDEPGVTVYEVPTRFVCGNESTMLSKAGPVVPLTSPNGAEVAA